MAWRCAGTVVASVCGWWLHADFHSVSTACYMVAYALGAWDLAKSTWEDLRRGVFDTHFLMLLVVPCTAAIGAWGEGALLLVLFSLSAALESYAMGRTHRAINSLLHGAPKTAVLVEAGATREISVEQVRRGDLVRVLPGQQVPVDLVVTTGETSCNEASFTGESLPVAKAPGDTMHSGTLNEHGVVDGRALSDAAGSTLARTIALIQQAQQMRSPSQRLAERFGTRYTLVVITACLALFFYAWLVDGWPPFLASQEQRSAFYRAMTLLVVMSPCALVISVPAAILSAIAAGARQGILFRGGEAVESLCAVSVVAMDKTGTLTEGQLRLDLVEALTGEAESVQALAAALAQASTHPVSRALVGEATRRRWAELPATEAQQTSGLGIEATVDGRRVRLGRRQWVADFCGVDLSASAEDVSSGQSEVWVGAQGSPPVLGRLRFTDQLRHEAPHVLEALRERHLESHMLTGDRPETAEMIGRQAGVTHIQAGLTPETKVLAIQRLKGAARRVAMIGDGINDAPSLAAADVSVAMGLRGSDAAIEQADIILSDDRLEKFVVAYDLSHRVRGIMRQNITIALGTMIVMAIAVCVGRDLPLALGVAMHEGSTITVVLNGLRLLRKPRK